MEFYTAERKKELLPFATAWMELDSIMLSEGIVGRGIYRSYYKGHRDKIKGEGRGGGGRWDWLGWGGGMGRKCRQL